ncbi:MAG: YggT family protein [Sphingomonadaceae bacterium]|nr:YggT family protein [Sphingomonadaceae bacterium]
MNTLNALLTIFFMVLTVITWLLIAQAIISWLIAFNVISLRSDGVRQIAYGLERLTDPLLRPIRRVLPNFGGVDISPLVLILLIQALKLLVPALLADAGALTA